MFNRLTQENKIFLSLSILVHILVLGLGLFLYDTLQDGSKSGSGSASPVSESEILLPVSVYSRAGLLDMDGNSSRIKKEIDEKLVQPLSLFHNRDGVRVVSVHIEVPRQLGEPYPVTVVFSRGNSGGLEEYSYGKRGETPDYWIPQCLDGNCYFTEEFKKKYPEIVKKAETNE